MKEIVWVFRMSNCLLRSSIISLNTDWLILRLYSSSPSTSSGEMAFKDFFSFCQSKVNHEATFEQI